MTWIREAFAPELGRPYPGVPRPPKKPQIEPRSTLILEGSSPGFLSCGPREPNAGQAGRFRKASSAARANVTAGY